MSTPKTTPKKLRNGPTIAVSEQILRWRSRLRREGRILGKHMAKAKEKAEQVKKERATDTVEKLRAKKWFE